MGDGLLLLHAWPMDARMWQGQVDALGDHARIIAPHHPGFGGSAPAGEVMTMRDSAERALAELDRSGVERVVVCGISMGGYAAFELWRRAPERIAGLVLANTRAVPDTPEAAEGRRELAARLRADGLGFFLQDPPPLLGARAPDGLPTWVRGVIADQGPEPIAAALLGMAERPDSTPDLPGIDVPTLVITSELDALIPPAVSLEMASRVPQVYTLEIPGAGHLSNLEAPEAFTQALEAHLARCGAG
jgi:3-oxoadipate enol-lactonase